MIFLKVRHFLIGEAYLVSRDKQGYEAGKCKCGFTNWFYFLAVFKEVFKTT